MIKRILFVLFILAPAFAVSQNYRPLPDSNAHWQLFRSISYGPGNWAIEYYYYSTDSIQPDTILNGDVYTKLIKHQSNPPFNEYIGSYRSDSTGKTWWIAAQDSVPSLLMDVAVQAGDTIFNIYGYDFNVMQIYYDVRVDSIDSYVSRNNVLRVVHVTTLAPYNGLRFHWVESIGSLNGFFNYLNGGLVQRVWHIICADDNDSVSLYRSINTLSWSYADLGDSLTSLSGSCSLSAQWIVDIHEASSADQLHCYPNPATTSLTLEPATNEPQQFRVYTTSGQLLLNRRIQGRSTIDVSDLPEGIYLLELETPEGVARQKLVLQR